MTKGYDSVNSQAQSVIKYYVICNRLKDTIRTGWQQWQVKRELVRSLDHERSAAHPIR